MPTPIRVLVVDDHALVRDMLADRLSREPTISVVGTAASADVAVDVAEQHQPDVVILDIDMPGLDCFEGARRILDVRPETRIVFLSAFTHDQYIDQALEIGAMGYVTKREPPLNIVRAIRDVAADRAYFSDEVRERIVLDNHSARLPPRAGSRLRQLTPRERDVLLYVARGLTKRGVAEVLGISVKTVEKHAENLMARLDIHDRVELARFAIREGLIEP